METILAIGAHPDDLELGVGGTLIKHVQAGDKVYGIVLSKGEKGFHCPNLTECIASAKLMGLEEIILLGFEDTKIPNDGDSVSAIREYIEKIKPDTLYTHTFHDSHQDHRNTSLAAQSAAKMRVSKVFLFETPSTTVEFTPHFFTVITETLDHKLRALDQYRSQLEREDSILDLDWVESRGLSWGFQTKPTRRKDVKYYAEAFEINHIIKY